MEQQLLVEDWGNLGRVGDHNIMVESRDGDGGLYLEGIFLQANVVNGNRRIYPKKVLQEAVSKYIKEQISNKQSIGELNHPMRSNPDPLHAAVLIEHLEWRGDNVWGRARVIEGDYAEGDKTAALIRAGWIPGVSSRGLGSLKKNANGIDVVQEGYRLTVGVDVVWSPSAPDAYVKPVFESVPDDQSNDSVVSENLATDSVTDEIKRLIESLERLSK